MSVLAADDKGDIERLGQRPAQGILIDLRGVTQRVLLAAAADVRVARGFAIFAAIDAAEVFDDRDRLIGRAAWFD